jgi:23S rRNA (guanosine2251-2'-O)-methyltransferase
LKTRKTEQIGKSGSDKEWIYGLNPVFEAIRAGRDIKCIFISSGRHSKLPDLIRKAAESTIPVKIAEPDFFDRTFRKGHQGVAAEVSEKGYISIDELFDIPLRKNEVPLFAVLDCVEDPRNFGAILRVADAAGIHGIIIQSHRSATLSSEVSKASSGAVEYIPVTMVTNIKHSIREMKERGITIIGTDSSANDLLWDIDLRRPLALVIGSEGRGLRKTVVPLCDALVKIPMLGKINSLNVSVASGIFAFEILRQRLRKN